jgi:hypothetical protein
LKFFVKNYFTIKEEKMKKWIVREGGFAILKILGKTFAFLRQRGFDRLIAVLVRFLGT